MIVARRTPGSKSTPAAAGAASTSTFLAHCRGRQARTSPRATATGPVGCETPAGAVIAEAGPIVGAVPGAADGSRTRSDAVIGVRRKQRSPWSRC